MNLQAGNPNLMKKVLRVNPEATLGHVPVKLGDKLPNKYTSGVYTPRERDPHEALPPNINVWEQPVYVPSNDQPARQGANNFLSIKSRGF
ncbi:hypothetical protein UFOVP38_59 [uncultured Caudovirales phage]|uniref:Uncharacterized protein n=1 Tax=uncultured Caudovirales phage TaxID=2100421 RepID=A0A6J5T958_9CAUD|nr:hypothetical protein UFOVP38_59 [uncultured Caudovirales phage]